MLQFVNIVQSETEQINRYNNKILGIGQFISSLHHVQDPIETSKTEHQMGTPPGLSTFFYGGQDFTVPGCFRFARRRSCPRKVSFQDKSRLFRNRHCCNVTAEHYNCNCHGGTVTWVFLHTQQPNIHTPQKFFCVACFAQCLVHQLQHLVFFQQLPCLGSLRIES